MAIGNAHKLGTVHIPTPRLFPKLCGSEDRHEQFLSAVGVHLVAHDGLDLLQGAPGQRQITVEAGCGLSNHAGTKQQAVACQVCIRRILF